MVKELNPLVHFGLHYTVHCAENSLCGLVHRFCISRKGGTGGGGWGHLQGNMHMVTQAWQ